MATAFLMMISVGVALGPLPQLFPKLGGVNAKLSHEQNRILGWYVLNYIIYVCTALPVFLFGRGALDHIHRRKAEYTLFTCVLGLTAAALIGPLMLWAAFARLGLWPIVGQPVIPTTQPSM